jgi:ketosteroid isomerase-like protein
MLRKVLFCSFIILTISCQPAELSKKEMRDIIHSRNEELGLLFKGGDAEKLSMIYSDSAKLCPNGADLYIGRNAIRDFWKQAMEGSKMLEMNTETLTVDGNREVIYETGKTTSKILFKDSVLTFNVKFANVWRKQKDGTYLLDVDIWNSLN